MSAIRRLAPATCPNCGASNTLYIAEDRRLTCRQCGEKAAQTEDEKLDVPPLDTLRARYGTGYGTPNTPHVERWAEVIYHTGMDMIHQEKYDEAIAAFERALDYQDNFIDAHLWIGRLSNDPDVKHEHYNEVIAQMPNHLESMRELMVLKGELTRAEADRAADSSNETIEAEATVPVHVEFIEVQCENCGGNLTAEAGQQSITCESCGHTQNIDTRGDYGMKSMAAALLKERGKGITWKVGEYILHCNNCAAERIITDRKMRSRCPFCGSRQVIKADALASFQQPDGIVPFQVSAKQARAAVEGALNSFTERMKGIFVNNDVDKLALTPVYMPFWLFDVRGEVKRTVRDKNDSYGYHQPARPRRETIPASRNNLSVCAVKSPPPTLTARLPMFETEDVRPYDPRLLAKATAEIYTIDYKKASFNARSRFREHIEFRYGDQPFDNQEVTLSIMIQSMDFRLVLMPVWVATIIEKDDDIRLALIHGQKSDVVLGKAKRPTG